MATPVEMPRLGNTVEECLIARWCKQPGDLVAKGEVIAEIETDKATFELTAPIDGTLLGTFFRDGELVPVFSNVCVLGKPGESIEEFRPRETTGADLAMPRIPTRLDTHDAREAVRPDPTPARPAGDSDRDSISPRARRFAETHGFGPSSFRGTGPGGRILEADVKRLHYESPRYSPLAKKMIADGHEVADEYWGTKRAVLSADLTPPPIIMSHVRERIAQRMRHSLLSTAQYTMNASAAATGLLALRSRIKAREERNGSPSININEMILFCTIKALMAAPEINAEFIDGKIYRHSSIHIGFACDTPRGLLVPVVRNSETFTLPELSLKIKSLTRQAIDGVISPDDLTGGTFTVSNLGIYGIESFSPILNPPQVALLGVNTIGLKPVRRNDGIDFVEHIGLSLTCDHQVIDGASGARFLKMAKEHIENIEKIAGNIGFEI
jgi:pyruvate dehydrogenase E2 component (dihydrolipoamide acetyltransferase)